MAKFLSQYSRWIIAIFGFVVFGLTQTTWLQTLPLWERMEGVSMDVRYTNRAGQPPNPNIELVGLTSTSFQLDDLSSNEIAASPTLQLMQQPWPWDRRVYAAVLDKLISGGAKVVMFDFVFASQTDGDDEFAQALHKDRDHVVIGEMFADEEGSSSATKKLTAPNPDLILSDTDSVVALVNMWTDSDGVVRQVKYKTSIEHESGLDQFNFPEDLIHITAVTVKKFTGQDLAPLDDALHPIDFQGAAGTYRPLPVEQMFVDRLWHAKNFQDGLVFSNKIVIVGPMAEIFHDIHPTPFGDMPGPELQAQIIGALLHHSWLTESSPAIGFVLALLMLWMGLEICLRVKSAIFKPILLTVTVILFMVICQVAFSLYKFVLPMVPPLFCLIVPGAFGIMFQFVLEQIERVRTRNVLERYVSKNVAKTILEDQRSFLESLSGRKKSVTVLFSDIRGFTSMTENTEAGKLVAQLNEYFSEMVGVVLKENGTLQKFIGDAIMAAWGDTHSEGLAEDARRAVSAALQMRPALAKLNEQWASHPDRKQWKIGIGVNHGEIIVGNIGHPQRMEFTVIGDGVNLAARLESSTKQFHTDILIGEETEKLTRDFFVFRNVGAIAFKGKTKPVETFVVLSDRTQPPPAWLAKYHEATRLYRGKQFELAMAKFREAQQEIGSEDFLCEMYIEQCENLFHQGLKSGWDGSFTLSEK